MDSIAKWLKMAWNNFEVYLNNFCHAGLGMTSSECQGDVRSRRILSPRPQCTDASLYICNLEST